MVRAIDMHNHLVAPEVVTFLEREGAHYHTRIVERDGQRFFVIHDTARRPLHARITQVEARLPDMDAEGVADEGCLSSMRGLMANDSSFLYPLSPQLQDRLRVRATKEQGNISRFVVQYEALIMDEWRPIVRYDTSHGFSHKDTLHPDGREDKQPLLFPSYNLAFTFAIQDLKASWRWYRAGYEREIHDDER